MFGRFDAQTYPLIRGYLEALRLYNNTHPIRGREHITPLRADRRQPDRCWLSASSVGCPHVVVGFYQTSQIVYYADGRITVALGWMETRTTRAFTDAILGEQVFFTSGGYLTFKGIHIVPRTSQVTLYRDAYRGLVLDDNYRGFPVYVGHTYAPRYKELGRRIALWRRQHKLLHRWIDSQLADRCWLANNSRRWAEILLEQPIVGGSLPVEWVRMPPPTAAMTSPYRLCTPVASDHHPYTRRNVVKVLSFTQMYDAIQDGRLSVKD